MLMDFETVEAGAQTVSAIIAAGMVPAALEMMDQLCVQAVEEYIHAGLPVDAAAVLLVEVAGLPHGLEADVERIVAIGRDARRAARCASPRTKPSGRCCGRAARRRSAPSPGSSRTTTCTTPWCRGGMLPEVLRQVYEIADRHDICW